MQCSHQIYFLILVVLVAAGTLFVPVQATENENLIDPGAGQPLAEKPADGLQNFEYQLEERPDPFVPFITNKTATQKIVDDIVEDNVELTGMRLFEPGQLTLVAVLYAGDRRMAMVEDVTGKGYILKEGMPIGRRGVVHRIDPEQVMVIETAHTRAGRKLQNKIFMRLNKEGDK